MALFSRRRLQRMIYENAAFMRPTELNDQVRRLNLSDREDYLSTEWEIGLLNAFSKVGRVQHEPDLGGTRLVDLLFRSPQDFEFAADIVTVSDQQLHKRNPVYPLCQELSRQVRKRQVTTGSFGLAVGHNPESFRGKGVRHNLLLPAVGKFKDVIFNAGFDAFIAKVKDLPGQPRVYRVHSATTDVTIQYKPGKPGTWTSSHLTYTAANIKDDNPVFNALTEKAKQLKASNYDGARGVIVCDGGCRMLTSRMNHWSEYSLEEVIADFFRQHQSVAFVVTVGLRHDSSRWVGRGHFRPELCIWLNRDQDAIKKPLEKVVDQMSKYRPVAETSAENALSYLKLRFPYAAHFGAMHMVADHEIKQIKLSAITILQLLAGKLDYATFRKTYQLDQRNPFALLSNQGRVITKCYIEHTPDEDDDWITFEFGDPDPAIAPFKSPGAKTTR